MSKLILFICFLYTTYCSILHNLTDSNFQVSVNNGLEKSWLVVFYLEKCPYCVKAKEALQSMSNKEDFNTHIGLVECTQNILTCMRFNITKVPYIVYFDKNSMFEFNSFPNENTLTQFINDEKTVSDAKQIPVDLGYIGLFFKLLKEAVHMINEYIKDYIVNKAQIEFEWEMYHTIILFSALLMLILLIEYFILQYLCRTKKNKIHVHGKNTTTNTSTTTNHVKKD